MFTMTFQLDNADAETFSIVYVDTPNGKINTFFAKDKSNVYYKERLVEQADADTFCVLLHPDYNTIVDYIPRTAVDYKNAYFKEKIIIFNKESE